MTKCGVCADEIRFVPTRAGKSLPVNAAPDPSGNVVVVDGLAVVLGPLECELLDASVVRWRPHFADCENWKRANR